MKRARQREAQAEVSSNNEDDEFDFELIRKLYRLNPEAKVLLVGDGNFSFSQALTRLAPHCQYAATAFESEKELKSSNLDEIFERIDALRAFKNCVGAHLNVDATKLSATLPADLRSVRFDVVIFQFPQHPERRKINKQRQLLSDFFRSALDVLAGEGRVIVSLCRGQGGTPFEEKMRKASDTWRVQEMAAEAGLLLEEVDFCPIPALASLGYGSTGFRARGLRKGNADKFQDRSFNWDGSLTHVFCRDDVEGVVAAYSMNFSHDISIWEPDGFSESLLLTELRSAIGLAPEPTEEQVPGGVKIECKLLDRYTEPKDGRQARTYRLEMDSQTKALTVTSWRKACEGVRAKFSRLTTGSEGPMQSEPRLEPGDDDGVCDAEGSSDDGAGAASASASTKAAVT